MHPGPKNTRLLIALPAAWREAGGLPLPEKEPLCPYSPADLAPGLAALAVAGLGLGIMGPAPGCWPGQGLVFAASLLPTRAFFPPELEPDLADLLPVPVRQGPVVHPATRRLNLAEHCLALALFMRQAARLQTLFRPDLFLLELPALPLLCPDRADDQVQMLHYENQVAAHLARLWPGLKPAAWLAPERGVFLLGETRLGPGASWYGSLLAHM